MLERVPSDAELYYHTALPSARALQQEAPQDTQGQYKQGDKAGAGLKRVSSVAERVLEAASLPAHFSLLDSDLQAQDDDEITAAGAERLVLAVGLQSQSLSLLDSSLTAPAPALSSHLMVEALVRTSRLLPPATPGDCPLRMCMQRSKWGPMRHKDALVQRCRPSLRLPAISDMCGVLCVLFCVWCGSSKCKGRWPLCRERTARGPCCCFTHTGCARALSMAHGILALAPWSSRSAERWLLWGRSRS
jgi:hypothetical protein